MGLANPNYGTGAFRRRLRIEARDRCVDIAVEDSNHGFRLTLRHDGKRVVEVVAEVLRHPFSTCPEASKLLLDRIVGCALDEDAAQLRRRLVPADNCTHLLDMALLAIDHAADVGLTRLYDICVADEKNGITLAQIDCDGERVHEWGVREHVVETPASLAGCSMMKGFYAWSSKAFSGRTLEAAMVLQRGYFVAQSRRYNFAGQPATADGVPGDSCYSYGLGVRDRALRVKPNIRDFSLSPAKLLEFEP